MRKELIVLAVVLLPTAVLLIARAVMDPPAPDPVEPPAPQVGPAPPRLADALVPAVPQPTPAALAAPTPAATPLPAEPAIPPTLEAPLHAVTPEVHRCFADRQEHLHGRVTVQVDFTPTPQGHFERVRVASTPDPTLAACLEDVFEERSFAPSGREDFLPARHTFVFDAPTPGG